MSQDNRNKTMFGRSPFHVDDDGAAVPAQQVRPPGGAPTPSLGFDEDGWDIDEVAISGSRPAAVSGASPVASVTPAASAVPDTGGSPGGSFFGGGTMRMQRSDVDDAVSAASMRRPAPEPESERPFTGTMRFRPEDLAGVTDRTSAPAESQEATQRAFTGTMRLSRNEMDAALAAVGVKSPPQASSATDEERNFTGTMRFRPEDLGALRDEANSPIGENPLAGGQASVRPASDPPQEATVRAFTGTMRFRPEDIDDVVSARATRSAASRSTVEASPELAESLRVRTIPNLTPQSLPALNQDADEAAGSEAVSTPAAEAPAQNGDAAAVPLLPVGSPIAPPADAPVPEPDRPVWGTIPIMVDDIPRLLQPKDGDGPAAEPEAAAPPVAPAAPAAEFGSTMVMGTQDVQDALAKVAAGSAAAAAASAPASAPAAAPASPPAPQTAAPAVTRAPLPPTVEGETAGLLRDLAPAAKASSAPQAAQQKSGLPIVAIVGGAIVLGLVVLVLYLFVL